MRETDPPGGHGERHTTHVLLVDDEISFSELLAGAIAREHDMEVVGTAKSVTEALAQVKRARPDVVVMDVRLPDGDGIDATTRVKALHPPARVLVLTSHSDADTLLRAAESGAAGWMVKARPVAEILHAIRTVAHDGLLVTSDDLIEIIRRLQGERAEGDVIDRLNLTPRELDVLACLSHGMDPSDAAEALSITVNTCRGYLKSLYAKLGVHSQLEAVIRSTHLGILPALGPD